MKYLQQADPSAYTQLILFPLPLSIVTPLHEQEFVSYFFLSKPGSSTADGAPDWRLAPRGTWRREWHAASHKEAVQRVYCCPAPLEAVITGGRGGQLKCEPWGGAVGRGSAGRAAGRRRARLSYCEPSFPAHGHLPLHCRLWSAADLAPLQTLPGSGGWVSDVAYVQGPTWRKLVVAAHDRTVRRLGGCCGAACLRACPCRGA